MDGFVDSNQQLLPTEDIIQRAAMITQAPEAYPQVYQSIAAELQKPGCQFFRQGNTLFIVHHLGHREGYARALNADVAKNYVRNSIDFVVMAYNLGYDRLIIDFDDQKLFQLFDIIVNSEVNPEMGYTGEEMTDGSYRVTIALGPERGGEI
ncbi:MAG: hypothetical protein EBR82_87245 [Caulobacteraceae bacterium]|nr:hypothetical protein [Caulobacteraceae bacterium]